MLFIRIDHLSDGGIADLTMQASYVLQLSLQDT